MVFRLPATESFGATFGGVAESAPFEPIYFIQANKLAADDYSTQDMGNSTEGAAGSGSFNYLLLQMQQSNGMHSAIENATTPYGSIAMSFSEGRGFSPAHDGGMGGESIRIESVSMNGQEVMPAAVVQSAEGGGNGAMSQTVINTESVSRVEPVSFSRVNSSNYHDGSVLSNFSQTTNNTVINTGEDTTVVCNQGDACCCPGGDTYITLIDVNIENIITEVTEIISPITDPVLGGVGDTLTIIIDFINGGLLEELLGAVGDLAGGILPPVTDTLAGVVDDFLGDGLEGVLTDPLGTVGDVLAGVNDSGLIDEILDAVDDLTGGLTEPLTDNLGNVVDDVLDGLSDTLAGGLDGVLDDVLSNPIGTIADLIGGGDAHAESETLVDHGLDILDGLTGGETAELTDAVGNVVNGIVDGAMAVVDEGLLGGDDSVLNHILDSVDDLTNGLSSPVTDPLAATVGSLLDGVQNIVDGHTIDDGHDNLVEQILQGVDDLTGGFIGPVTEPLGAVSDGLINGLDELLSPHADSSLVDGALDVVDGLTGGATNDVTDFVGDIANGVIGGVTDVLVHGFDGHTGGLDGLPDLAGLGDLFTDPVGFFESLFGGNSGSGDVDLTADVGANLPFDTPLGEGLLDVLDLDVGLDPIEAITGDIDIDIDAFADISDLSNPQISTDIVADLELFGLDEPLQDISLEGVDTALGLDLLNQGASHLTSELNDLLLHGNGDSAGDTDLDINLGLLDADVLDQSLVLDVVEQLVGDIDIGLDINLNDITNPDIGLDIGLDLLNPEGGGLLGDTLASLLPSDGQLLGGDLFSGIGNIACADNLPDPAGQENSGLGGLIGDVFGGLGGGWF